MTNSRGLLLSISSLSVTMKVYASQVNAVECGSAALEELNKPENEFDLVLLDLILPDIVLTSYRMAWRC